MKLLFAKRLKEARNTRGYTQNKLSELSDVHEKSIARYEAGTTAPTADNVVKLAQALEVSIDYLLLPYAQMQGIRKIKYPDLYERYFVIEELDEEERKAILTVLDSLIARQKMRDLSSKYAFHKK